MVFRMRWLLVCGLVSLSLYGIALGTPDWVGEWTRFALLYGLLIVAYLSALCHVAYTATQYALLSSTMALARTVLSAPGGVLADATGWVLFFLITTVAALPGLLLWWWLKRRGIVPEVEARPLGAWT